MRNMEWGAGHRHMGMGVIQMRGTGNWKPFFCLKCGQEVRSRGSGAGKMK